MVKDIYTSDLLLLHQNDAESAFIVCAQVPALHWTLVFLFVK